MMEIELNKKIAMFSNCILVNGANRSIICDLQRNNFEFIPNDLYSILKEFEGRTVNEIFIAHVGSEAIILEYFDFLNKHEYIFFTDKFENYPKIDLSWDSPFKIINAIIDLSSDSNYNLKNIIIQLDELGCMFLEIRVFNYVLPQKIKELILSTSNTRIKGIEIILCNSNVPNLDFIYELINLSGRLLKFTIHSCEKDEITVLNKNIQVIYTKQKVTSSNHCGFIHPSNFIVDLDMFTESQQHNSCLNRKISIDVNGLVKNCPSMINSFGAIDEVKLKDIINDKTFNNVWSINKNQIDICKDCEFRYICTDCRAFIENTDDDYSKPLKCGYNPYTNKWDQWSTNPLKEKAIEFYGM